MPLWWNQSLQKLDNCGIIAKKLCFWISYSYSYHHIHIYVYINFVYYNEVHHVQIHISAAASCSTVMIMYMHLCSAKYVCTCVHTLMKQAWVVESWDIRKLDWLLQSIEPSFPSLSHWPPLPFISTSFALSTSIIFLVSFPLMPICTIRLTNTSISEIRHSQMFVLWITSTYYLIVQNFSKMSQITVETYHVLTKSYHVLSSLNKV